MKVTKSQLEALIRESVNEQVSNLNEEELEELLGGLKGMFGAAGAGIKKGAQAVGGAAQRAGSAVQGAAQRAGSAVTGAAQRAGSAVTGAAAGAAGAVKGAYQAGEATAALGNVKKAIQAVGTTVDKALQTVKADPEKTARFQSVQDQAQALEKYVDAALAESAKGRRARGKKSAK